VTYIAALALFIALVLAVWFGWRFISQRRSLPCPTSLAWLLENPFTSGYHSVVLSRLELSPGLHVLDAGCGPGILTTAIAAAVAPQGRVLALDIQAGMIAKAQARAAKAGISNIDYLVAPLGEGEALPSHFDRALLVTVLGEIPDKAAALREIRAALKPGGFLSITEVLPDPHYQSLRKVNDLAHQAGLRFRNKIGNSFMFTVNLERPLGA
jgi:ubiquinone/menaquinone biosynthesis C-methylase UbiE